MSKEYKCSILNRKIHDGYCYEITLAAYGMLKMDYLQDKIDRETARRYCENCENNQIND